MIRSQFPRWFARGLALVSVLAATLAPVGLVRAAGQVTVCTEQGLADAMNLGSGLITFDCGPNPVVIPMTLQNGGLNVGPGYACDYCTIDGGNKVTLSGAGTHRLFDVRVNGALTLTHIILADGHTDFLGNLPDWGGAILDEGSLLVLDHVTIQNSYSLHAGGALRIITGTAIIRDSLIENNRSDADAGGIRNTGTLSITHSTLAGNRAALGIGGGIFNSSSLAIADSTIGPNNAADTGGGVYNHWC